MPIFHTQPDSYKYTSEDDVTEVHKSYSKPDYYSVEKRPSTMPLDSVSYTHLTLPTILRL